MLILEKKSAVIEKTQELCQTILDQSAFKDMQASMEAFMADPEATRLYHSVLDLQDNLQKKQQQGEMLTPDEMTAFESQRDVLLANPVAKSYIDAQQQIHKVQESILKYVAKTFELGRMPTEDDLQASGCCGGGGGGGCGCG